MNFASLEIADGRMKGSGFDLPVPTRFKTAVGGGARKIVAGFRPEHFELGGVDEGLVVRAKADVVEVRWPARFSERSVKLETIKASVISYSNDDFQHAIETALPN